MAIVALLPLSTIQAGPLVLGPMAALDSRTSIGLTMLRDNWPDTGGDIINAQFEVSFDNGVTWQFFAGFTTAGGIVHDPNGVLMPNTWVKLELPKGTGRLLKGTINIATAISTKIDVEVM